MKRSVVSWPLQLLPVTKVAQIEKYNRTKYDPCNCRQLLRHYEYKEELNESLYCGRCNCCQLQMIQRRIETSILRGRCVHCQLRKYRTNGEEGPKQVLYHVALIATGYNGGRNEQKVRWTSIRPGFVNATVSLNAKVSYV